MNERSSLQHFLEDDLLRWKVVAVHFVLFCMTMAFLGTTITSGPIPVNAGTLPPPSESSNMFPLFSVVWVALLVLHLILTISNKSTREKAQQFAEKPKRQYLEIGDDGELVEIVEAEEKEKNRRA